MTRPKHFRHTSKTVVANAAGAVMAKNGTIGGLPAVPITIMSDAVTIPPTNVTVPHSDSPAPPASPFFPQQE